MIVTRSFENNFSRVGIYPNIELFCSCLINITQDIRHDAVPGIRSIVHVCYILNIEKFVEKRCAIYSQISNMFRVQIKSPHK
jgi:hypothetical protein